MQIEEIKKKLKSAPSAAARDIITRTAELELGLRQTQAFERIADTAEAIKSKIDLAVDKVVASTELFNQRMPEMLELMTTPKPCPNCDGQAPAEKV